MNGRCKFTLIITPAHGRVNPIPNTADRAYAIESKYEENLP
jgi:hypothetical protein